MSDHTQGSRDEQIVLETLFRESRGQPINYQGKTLCLMDRVPVQGRMRFEITRESTNSGWRQGIRLWLDEGSISIAETTAKAIVLWEDTAPERCTFEVDCATGILKIKNVWDTGNGVMESGHNGAAIWVEQIEDARRYHCNDGHPNDDLNDLVFSLRQLA